MKHYSLCMSLGALLLVPNFLFAKKPVGLPNCGASCYLNSVMQNLYNMTLLRELVIQNKNIYKPNSAAIDFIELMEQMKTAQKIKSEYILEIYHNLMEHLTHSVSDIQVPQFTKGRQEDAQEFLSALLDNISSTDIAGNKNQANGIKNLYFFNQHKQIIIPVTNEKMSPRIEPSAILSLPIQSTDKNLVDILGHYFLEPEHLEEYTDQQTGIKYNTPGNLVKRITRISYLPEYLMVQLVVFELDLTTGERHKILTPITISPQLDLKPYVDNPMREKNTVYELIGISVHMGSSIQSGHYIAYVKTTPENKWWLCNDRNVDEQTPPFIKPNWHPTDDARPYLLFYKRKDNQVSPIEAPIDISNSLKTLEQDLSALLHSFKLRH